MEHPYTIIMYVMVPEEDREEILEELLGDVERAAQNQRLSYLGPRSEPGIPDEIPVDMGAFS